MDYERSTVSRALISSEDLGALLDAGVRPYLFEGEAKAAFEWIVTHHEEHGCIPTQGAFVDHHPSFKGQTEATDAPGFLADKLRERWRYNQILDALSSAQKPMLARDPTEAAEVLQRALDALDEQHAQSDEVDWSSSAPARVEEHVEDVESGAPLTGLSSPFKMLDELTSGFQPGDLILIAAESGTGKTWFETVLAHHVWSENGVPYLVSREMETFKMLRRLDAKDAGLEYRALRARSLSDDDVSRWREQAAAAADRGIPFWVCGDPDIELSTVFARARRKRVSALFIDGLETYANIEDGRRSDWLTMLALTKRAKLAARRLGIPVFASLQLTEEEKLARARQMRQDADVIIYLRQDSDLRLARQIEVSLKKNREGSLGEAFKLTWDFVTMTFEDAPVSRFVRPASPTSDQVRTIL